MAEPRLNKPALVERNEQCCVVFLVGERKKIGLEKALKRSELGGREKGARRGEKLSNSALGMGTRGAQERKEIRQQLNIPKPKSSKRKAKTGTMS